MFNNFEPRPTLLVLALVTLLLAACAGATPVPTATPVPEPTATPVPEPTVISVPPSDAASTGGEEGGLRTFVVVPDQSRASYLVDEQFLEDALAKLGIKAGLSDVVGSTQEIEGQLQLNLDDLAAPLGETRFTVKVNTLTTDQDRRDNWIRENGPRFNDFPIAEFVATGVEDTPSAYSEGQEVQFKLAGNLTIRDVTQPAVFEVTAKLGDGAITGTATTRLLMSDFGIDPPNFVRTLTVEDEFGLEVEITAVEQ